MEEEAAELDALSEESVVDEVDFSPSTRFLWVDNDRSMRVQNMTIAKMPRNIALNMRGSFIMAERENV